MDDLISRKALLEDINAAAGNDFMGTMVAGTLTRFVKKQPAVDAEPVVHGRWEAMHYEGGILDGANCERCSNCGWDRFFDEPEIKSVFRYCPKCGALMDGGNDDEN